MPKFIIEQYELHSQKHEVEADSVAEAIIKLFDGDGTPVDNGLEYIEVAEDYAQADLFSPDQLEKINENHTVDWDDASVPSIRGIEEIED